MSRRRILIMGAAGRDFHNFNTLCRGKREYQVLAFTATQIPNIEGRTYPAVLANALYPDGVPIRPESELEELIREEAIDEVWFSYSDVPHAHVMHQASRATAAGADFRLCSARSTMLESSKPVIAVTAVRTGVGKSQTTRFLAGLLKRMDKRTVLVRHPMPYGDLAKQVCQRFATLEDLDFHETTIEEREEYEPIIRAGFVVYAGVDYEQILRRAESEADVVLWDGGNNDTPFFRPDLHLVLVDPHRAGDELAYHPGETNLRMADVVVVNKVGTAEAEDVERVEANCRRTNPRARIVRCRSRITVEKPELIRGKRALIVEDGPTLTHGGMEYGAGWIAAREAGAAEMVDPVPWAVGSLKKTYDTYPNARRILPAMGYGAEQIRELEATINAAPADVVIGGTPIDLARILTVEKPLLNVTYELEEVEEGLLEQAVRAVLD